MREMRENGFCLAPLAILGMLLFIAIGGEIVMQLWNWLLPPLFGWRQITFWQALGLLALCRILFGGFERHGFSSLQFRRRMAERWDHMTLRSGNDSGKAPARTLRLRPIHQREQGAMMLHGNTLAGAGAPATFARFATW